MELLLVFLVFILLVEQIMGNLKHGSIETKRSY
jgi:hypothetical protein